MTTQDEELGDPLIPGFEGRQILLAATGFIALIVAAVLLPRSFNYLLEAQRLDDLPPCQSPGEEDCVWTETAAIVDGRIEYEARSEDEYYVSFDTTRGVIEERVAYSYGYEVLATATRPVIVTGLGADLIAAKVDGETVVMARHPDFAWIDHLVFGAAALGFGLMCAVGLFLTRAHRAVPKLYLPPLVRPRLTRDIDPATGAERWSASPALLVRFQMPFMLVTMVVAIANLWSDFGARGLGTTAVITALLTAPMYVGSTAVTFDRDAIRYRGGGVEATVRRWTYGSRVYYHHEHPRLFIEDGDVRVHQWSEIYHALNKAFGEDPERVLDVNQLVIAARSHGVVDELERRFDAGSAEGVAVDEAAADASVEQPRPKRRRHREDSGWSWRSGLDRLFAIPIFAGVAGLLGVFGIGMFGEGEGAFTGDFANLLWAVPSTALGLWLMWRFDERKGGESRPQIARFVVIYIALTAAVAIVIPLLF